MASYKDCPHYNDGYCLNGGKKATGVPYDCVRRNDCPYIPIARLKLEPEVKADFKEKMRAFRNALGESVIIKTKED